MATGQPCQLCTEGGQATHQCVECAQALCATCQQTHLTSQPSHTLQPLTDVTPEAAIPEAATPEAATPAAVSTEAVASPSGGGRRGRVVTGDTGCPIHQNQLLQLYCCQCEVTLCIVCKLTSHGDHKTEDLMDTGKKARAELSEELQAVIKREQVLRAFLIKAHDFQDDLHKEKQSVEEKILDRTHELRQMVEKAQAEAMESVAVTTEKALNELKEQTVPIEERHAATETKLQHISGVINSGADSEAVTLSAQLKEEASKADKRRSENFMVERGTIRHEFRIRAVKFTNVLAFVGSAIEGPVMEAKSATPDVVEPLEVSIRPGSQPVSDSMLSKQRISKVGRSTTPVVIFYSKNPKSTLAAMHLMSTDDDFWLNFNPGGNVPLFGFFDDDGHMKELHSENIPSSTVLVTCDGDTVVSVNNGRWVRAGNGSGALETFTPWEGTAASKSSPPYLLKQQSIFKLLSDALPPQIEEAPTYTVDVIPTAFDVSENGQFVAATVDNTTVKVFDKVEAAPALRSYADYVENSGGAPSDVCFCMMEGKEVLLVAYTALNTVHILDHKDGCCFIRTLETEKHPVTAPCRLTTNHHGRVWVGCNGGRVVIFEI